MINSLVLNIDSKLNAKSPTYAYLQEYNIKDIGPEEVAKEKPLPNKVSMGAPKNVPIPVAMNRTVGTQRGLTVLNKITNVNNGADIYAMEDPGTYISPFLDKQYNYKV